MKKKEKEKKGKKQKKTELQESGNGKLHRDLSMTDERDPPVKGLFFAYPPLSFI